jgi:hypothetical protein
VFRIQTPTSPPLNLSNHISSGWNLIRYIQLGVSSRFFALHAFASPDLDPGLGQGPSKPPIGIDLAQKVMQLRPLRLPLPPTAVGNDSVQADGDGDPFGEVVCSTSVVNILEADGASDSESSIQAMLVDPTPALTEARMEARTSVS